MACGGSDGAAADRVAFPQSVASGDPRPDSVVLWTRAVNPDQPDGDVTVAMEVATDERFGVWSRRRKGWWRWPPGTMSSRSRSTGLAAADALLLSVPHHPRRRLWYSPVGRTLTAPELRPAGTHPAGLRELPGLRGPLLQRLANSWSNANQDLDLVLFIGDYIYETAKRSHPGGRPVARGGLLRSRVGDVHRR